jgi:hypothetical protein
MTHRSEQRYLHVFKGLLPYKPGLACVLTSLVRFTGCSFNIARGLTSRTGNLLILGIGLFAAGQAKTVDPGKIGVVLSYALGSTYYGYYKESQTNWDITQSPRSFVCQKRYCMCTHTDIDSNTAEMVSSYAQNEQVTLPSVQ